MTKDGWPKYTCLLGVRYNLLSECLAIDSGGYVYEQPSRINCSVWLDASQRR